MYYHQPKITDISMLNSSLEWKLHASGTEISMLYFEDISNYTEVLAIVNTTSDQYYQVTVPVSFLASISGEHIYLPSVYNLYLSKIYFGISDETKKYNYWVYVR